MWKQLAIVEAYVVCIKFYDPNSFTTYLVSEKFWIFATFFIERLYSLLLFK